MNKLVLQETVELTKECLKSICRLDCELLLSYCDKDTTYIGSLNNQYCQSCEEVEADIRASIAERKSCHILMQDFYAVRNSASSCTVFGRYIITTDESTGYFLQEQQRCTFVWSQTKEELKIKHIHFSAPVGELKVGAHEKFANIVGEMSKRYIERKIKEISSANRVSVTDNKGVVRFLPENKVLYISANQKQTVIHMNNEKVNIRKGFSETLSMFPDFVRIHRSYAVNRDYVYEIGKNSVVMTNGEEIHIPVKKYREVRESLMKIDNK